MAHPIFVWRLDELDSMRTIRTTDSGAELKIENGNHRTWLHEGLVKVQERQEGFDDTWKTIEKYEAKTTPTS